MKINSVVNGIVWGPLMLCVLLGIGVFYTIKLRFFQIRHFRLWWDKTFLSLFRKNNSRPQDKKALSPFQAMSTALAGAIGTGNIVGVASAITLGGAGAVFWMWVAALFGMATIFAENSLGIRYREKHGDSFVGGPMYYIEKGLHCKWGAVLFAVFCTLAAFGMGNMVQANSVAGALENGFGISPSVCAVVLTALVGLIIFGGIGRIAALTEKLVPFMAILFLAASCIVLAVHIRQIPAAFAAIFTQAFDLQSAAGGFMGYGMAKAIKYGISRGVFSNEAGLGTSPIVYAAADSDDPWEQGMWGMFQVFIDTIVLCTLMALCILCSVPDADKKDGIALSISAFESVLGTSGKWFLSVSIVLFAFATLISWCYYGEKSFEYLSGGRFILLYRLIYVGATTLGCMMQITMVWELSDTLNGLMALPNMAALIALSGKIRYDEIRISDRKQLTVRPVEPMDNQFE